MIVERHKLNKNGPIKSNYQMEENIILMPCENYNIRFQEKSLNLNRQARDSKIRGSTPMFDFFLEPDIGPIE